MLIQNGAGEAERSRVHGLGQQCADACRFLRCGRSLHRFLAQNVVTERRERRQKREVEGRPAALRGIHVLGEGLPVPADATFQEIVGNRLDIDQIAHRDLTGGGAAGGEAHAAVAHHDAGDTVPGRGRHRAVPADLRVVVRVRIDESGRNYTVGGVDRRFARPAHATDFDDPSIVDRHIGVLAGPAGSVYDQPVADDQIECHCCSSCVDLLGRRARECAIRLALNCRSRLRTAPTPCHRSVAAEPA